MEDKIEKNNRDFSKSENEIDNLETDLALIETAMKKVDEEDFDGFDVLVQDLKI